MLQHPYFGNYATHRNTFTRETKDNNNIFDLIYFLKISSRRPYIFTSCNWKDKNILGLNQLR